VPPIRGLLEQAGRSGNGPEGADKRKKGRRIRESLDQTFRFAVDGRSRKWSAQDFEVRAQTVGLPPWANDTSDSIRRGSGLR